MTFTANQNVSVVNRITNNHRSLGICIQARTGSTRLPHKMTLPFHHEKGILELLLERLIAAGLDVPMILATTINKDDTDIANIGRKHKIEVFRGSENNVLERFVNVATKYKFVKIIRICADNLFLDMADLRSMINQFIDSDADYWCYCTSRLIPTIKTHWGLWGEGVTLEALTRVKKSTHEKKYQEHVTNYVYEHPYEFVINSTVIPKSIENEKDIRLTIDTEDDFRLLKEIYSQLILKGVKLESKAIVAFIKNKPQWLVAMKKNIVSNEK